MKSVSSFALAVLVVIAPGAICLGATPEEGVALAIIYDTSGSMKENVRDKSGNPAPKYVIANRALASIARQIQAFATNTASGSPRKVHAGLFIFSGMGAKEALKFGPFDATAIQEWAQTFSNPNGNTPLGKSLETAAQAVLNSPLSRKHVLVITDGINTSGPTPAVIMPKLKQLAEDKHAALSVHFVAFDVDAKVFDPVKKLGATVVGAADEKQLGTQLEFIMQRKILLEEEEAPKKKS
jgi:von Willebrand factor type A domain-containing protein